MIFSAALTALGLISLSAAILYPALRGEGVLRACIKALAVGILALTAFWFSGAPGLALALALSAFGDFALARPGDRWFLAGMLGFGAAHLVYAALFSQLFVGFDVIRLVAMALLVAVAFLLGRAYSAQAGDLKWPVRIYVGLIALMGLTAIGAPLSLVSLGAALFIVSDALIGQQRFLGARFKGQDLAIWASYYLAQVALVLGWLSRHQFL